MRIFSALPLGLLAAIGCLASQLATPAAVRGDVQLPAVFSSHMVLQQGQADRVWGWADPSEKITVTIAGQSHETQADAHGNWTVQLESLKAGGPHTLTVQGKNRVAFEDVLVGEVWICSGQSNMAWPVKQANDSELEMLGAKYPQIRLLSVPQVGTQEPQRDFKGAWQVCSPETVGEFSAVGYFFGRQLHQVLDVPIGLIDNAWGGSACEAWIRRDLLAADARYQPLLQKWSQVERGYDHEKALANFRERQNAWKQAAAKAREAGKPVPPAPRAPANQLTGNHRPANIYNGVLKPTIGYGIRGAIWYQGEANAGRAYQYRELFPLMIKSWRDEWGQGDFPFYWVQLADFRAEQPQPAESDWAELREAQTMTLERLPHTGQAVIIDGGESQDIHPRHKQLVGRRLARWALAQDYGIDIPYRSPEFESAQPHGNKLLVTLEHVGEGLKPFDVGEPQGFAIAGEDRKFHWAQARVVGKNQIEVWSDEVQEPVAVRYAWADNPVANLYTKAGLPVTPFRSDEWPGVTVNAVQ